MNRIPTILKKKIIQSKGLSLYDYIDFCLYDKKLGYYQNLKNISNDFTTSPEISQVFGECIAIFFQYVLQSNFSNKNILRILELGPGNGTLSNDIVRVLSKKKEIELYLFEISKELIKKQKLLLKKNYNFKINISWVEKINFINKKPTLFFCNEFFDALPIDQFKKESNSWKEKRIFIKNNKLVDSFVKTKKTIPAFYKNTQNDNIIEYSKLTKKYASIIFNHIEKFGGLFLIFDYGPLKKKTISTIQSIHCKNKCGILDFPTFSDITYHVDFSFLINLSMKYNLKHFGPLTQNKFLNTFGIKERVTQLLKSTKNTDLKKKIHEDYMRLISEKSMGDLFKCLIFTNKNLSLSL